MPRRSAGGTEESPAPRRSSSRIASQVSKSPATPSPVKKSATKRASKKLAEETTSDFVQDTQIDTNGMKVPVVLHSGDQESSEPLAKQQKLDETHTEANVQDNFEIFAKTDEETGFEIIEKGSLPTADSAEVKEALSAQGDDGHLLVNFVQVSKDELPPPAASASITRVEESGAVPVEATTIMHESLSPSLPETVSQETHPIPEHADQVLYTGHQYSEMETEQEVLPETTKVLDTVVVIDSESPSPQDMEAAL